MTVATLLAIGLLTGLTTVLFGFGGGFVTVPVILWLDAAAGPAAPVVAVATSSVVMIVNAAVATAATPRDALARLGSSRTLLVLLALGGALGALAANLAPHRLITWGFIAYLALTIVDVLLRPGFLGPGRPATAREGAAIPTGWGLGIGSLASFLGVGGSVMTVPMLRRSGLPMQLAATLANPLTLCISIPAGLVFLVTAGALPGLRIGPNDGPLAGSGIGLFTVGAVDVGAAALLLTGAVPVVIALRRRPPRIPDRLHAWGYVGLLGAALSAALAAAW